MIKSNIKGKQTNRDKNFGCLVLAYRGTPQESTKFTPNTIMLVKEVKLPLQVIYCDPEKHQKNVPHMEITCINSERICITLIRYSGRT